MNKSTKILALVAVLLGLAYWMLSKQPWRTVERGAADFSISDTNLVTKIFMANKQGQTVLLERTPQNQWLVNHSIVADEFKIKLLLGTLHDMQIQMPIPPSMHNTAIGILATQGIKTEIYAGDKILKTIYVGSETPDKTGTFMMLEGDEKTYSIHIPGFVGFLTPRFFLSEIKWRSKLIYDVKAEDIAELQIQYPTNPEESFTYNAASYLPGHTILNNAGNPMAVDTMQVHLLLHSFEQKYAEGFYDDSTYTKTERDSLFKLTPYCSIRLKQKNGAELNMALYNKPIGDKTKDRYDEKGNERTIDPEKFYAKLSTIEQIASVQEYAFRRILVKASMLKK
ncbi:MAG: hypothetical protein CFE21_01365 [Bacteroidetes bacterium B1(2017)]|nr:MAG: hypothetical protein CFE21_01365 [Bacteroidetes bacterium B1(2017)]